MTAVGWTPETVYYFGENHPEEEECRMAATLFRDANIIDGTGGDAFAGDVLVVEDRIAAVGSHLDRPSDGTEVDLQGLTLAPGFVDPHTHYDAQALWDPDFTPSCWHGITSVVMGNCGYSVAPTCQRDRETVVLMLEAVEGMSRAALEDGITWGFETYPEYLETLAAAGTRLNV